MWTGRRRHDGSARGGQTRQPGGVPLHHDNDGGIETHQQPGRRRLDAAGLGLRAPEVPHRQVRHLFFLKKNLVCTHQYWTRTGKMGYTGLGLGSNGLK